MIVNEREEGEKGGVSRRLKEDLYISGEISMKS